MPLRDHFRPPVSDLCSWQEMFGGWPSIMVRDLFSRLPPNYRSSPLVRPRQIDSDRDEYEVRIHEKSDNRIVAQVVFATPLDKAQAECSELFVTRIREILRAGICVAIIDIASIPRLNLYTKILDSLACKDQTVEDSPHSCYAFTARARASSRGPSILEAWYHPMAMGEPLPTVSIWLNAEACIPLPLEPNYEETCRYLHIA